MFNFLDIDDLNPIIFVGGLLCAYILWLVLKMFSVSTASIGSESRNILKNWRIKQKINNWKQNNKRSTALKHESVLEYASENDITKYEHFQFFGCDSDGRTLLIDFNCFNDRKEAHLFLKLSDGRILTLPRHPLIGFSTHNTKVLSVDGLMVEQILPYAKWRIIFNGLLKVHKPNEPIDNEIGNSAHEQELMHVIFTFFWTAASDPINWPNDWNSDLLARILGNAVDTETQLNNLLFSDSGFDQFGSLFGQVTIETEATVNEIIEINLPGLRRNRCLSRNEIAQDHSQEHVTVVGVCKDGCVFSILAKDIDEQKHVYSGCVRMPNGDVFAIDYTSLNVANLQIDQFSNEVVFDFRACGKLFSLSMHINTDSMTTVYTEKDKKHLTTFSLNMNGFNGNGLIIINPKPLSLEENQYLMQIYRKMRKHRPQFVLQHKQICDTAKLVLLFTEIETQNEQLCGGKGSSLGYLTQLSKSALSYGDASYSAKNFQDDFIVPRGFTLTTRAFDLQVQQNKRLQDAMDNVKQIACKRTNGSLESACSELIKLFHETPIENEIVNAVQSAYDFLKANAKTAPFKLAVRSSAVGEDGISSSSAGQNETVLGVKGIDQILIAIRKCWASLFTVQSVTYRLQNILPIRSQMAVVVQRMVSAKVAGVLFTCHPVNNDPNKLLVTANYGLGESVVSALVDPDVFVIQRAHKNNNMEILERKLGEKSSFVHLTENGQVNSSSVDESLRKQYCMQDQQLMKLCEIGIFLEKNYGSPRDVEWAIVDNQIYLLQSRPMTSIYAFSSWELLHEFDTAVMSNDDLFTFGNVGEVMPEVLTPLTISITVPAVELGIAANMPDCKPTMSYCQLFKITHYRIAIEVFNVFLRLLKTEISIENRAHGMSIFGHEFVTKEIHQLAIHRNGIGSSAKQLIYLWDVIKCAWSNKSTVNEIDAFMKQFIGIYDAVRLETFATMLDLYNDISVKAVDGLVFVNKMHGRVTKVSTFYQIIAFSVLAEGKQNLTVNYVCDIALMLGSCKDVVSAEIPVLIEEIALAICQCSTDKLNAFARVDSNAGMNWLEDNCTEAYALLSKFLAKYFHRGFQEFDFGCETWGMKPSLVIEMIQNSTQNLTIANHARKKQNRTNDEIIAELKTPTRSLTRKIIKFLLPRCQSSVQMRETTKNHLIVYIHELRKAYRYLAVKMQQAGLLPDPELIFFLQHTEIGNILTQTSRNDLIGKAIRRRRMFPEWRKLRFTEFQSGVMQPLNSMDSEKFAILSKTEVIGTPVCQGIITGRACVINTFAEVSKIKAGDILITHSTDIAWSPYFPILGGVITELGGLISHGAVVAREYGLPCIVGATDATSIISDGEIIIMNANTGVIVKSEGE